MNKGKIFLFIAVSIMVSTLFLKLKKRSYPQTQVLNFKTLDKEEKKFFKKIKLEPPRKLVNEIKTSQKFQRKKPKFYFSRKNISFIAQKNWTKEQFAQWAKKQSPISSENNPLRELIDLPEWDIYQLPKSNAEFKLWLNEATLHSYYKLSSAIEGNDGANAVLAAAAVEAFHFMKIFKFEGYDKNGQWTLSLKKEKEFVLKSLQKKSPTRLPAGKQNSLFSMIDNTDSFSADEIEALSSLKRDRTPYGEALSGHDVRQSIYTKGDLWEQDIFKVLDYIVGLTNTIGFSNTPNSFHLENQKTIDKIIQNIQNHPAAFGYTKKEFEKIKDFNITDIDLHLLIQRVVHYRAKTTALWGAGVSSVIGSKLSALVSKARAWKYSVLTTIGIETIFMSYGCYQGIKQIYVLHRYYSYMRGQRKAAEFSGRTFNLIAAKQGFTADSIHFDRHFKMDAFRAWLIALGSGLAINSQLNRQSQKGLSQGFSRFVAIKWINAARSNSSSKSVLKLFNLTLARTFLKLLQSATWNALFIRFFPKVPSQKVFSFLRGVKKYNFFTPANLILTAIDFGVTSIAMYSLTYNILYNSSLALIQTDPSPSMSIQLSLASVDERNEEFYDATQKILYPLCVHLAIKKKEDVYEENYSLRAPRQKACLNIISALEGLNQTSIASSFPRIHNTLSSKEAIHVDYSQYMDLIYEAHHYPTHYRVVWLSALRSIYGLKHIPEIYGALEARFTSKPSTSIHDKHHNLAAFFRSPAVSRNYMNIERLNYAIELLAIDIERLKNNSGQTRQEPSIANNIPSIEHAWIAYMKYYQKVTKNNVKYLIQELAKREDMGFWSGLGYTLSSFGQIIRMGWSTFWSKPSEWSFRNKVRRENGLILNPEAYQSIKKTKAQGSSNYDDDAAP